MSRRGGSELPDKTLELLLQAALWHGPSAMDAWRAWYARTGLDRFDYESFRLLPLVYHNLKQAGLEQAVLSKLKSITRATWYKNQLALRDLEEILRGFKAAGIRPVLLKGTALALLYYKDLSLRPMNDCDILVPPAQALAACRHLLERGWRCLYRHAVPPEYIVAVSHAVGFRNSAKTEIDLHWRAMLESVRLDQGFRDRAVPLRVGGVEVHALAPTDMLLHVLVHATRWSRLAPLRWVADALAILAGGQVDWDALTDRCIEDRLTLQVRDTLTYLKNAMRAEIPEQAMRALSLARPSRLEHFEHWIVTRHHSLLGKWLRMWYDYSRSLADTRLLGRLKHFPAYSRRMLFIDHLWQVPFYTFYRRRAVRALGKENA